MFDEKKKALNLLTKGLPENINPHKSFVILTKYYKYNGIDKQRASDLLLDWLKKQKCSLEFSEVISDLNRVINDVYKKNYKFMRDIKINFYESEIEYIKTLNSKGEKSVALSLLYLSKIYGKEFYCYHFTLHKLTNLSIRHIKRLIKKLSKYGFIDILVKNETKKVIAIDDKYLKRYSLPNTYKIKVKEDGSVILKCEDIDSIYEILSLLI